MGHILYYSDVFAFAVTIEAGLSFYWWPPFFFPTPTPTNTTATTTTMMMIPTGAKKIFITHLRKQKQSNLFFFSAEKDKIGEFVEIKLHFQNWIWCDFVLFNVPIVRVFLKKISPILASFCLFTSSSQLKYKLKRIDIVLGIRTQAPRMYWAMPAAPPIDSYTVELSWEWESLIDIWHRSHNTLIITDLEDDQIKCSWLKILLGL